MKENIFIKRLDIKSLLLDVKCLLLIASVIDFMRSICYNLHKIDNLNSIIHEEY